MKSKYGIVISVYAIVVTIALIVSIFVFQPWEKSGEVKTILLTEEKRSELLQSYNDTPEYAYMPLKPGKGMKIAANAGQFYYGTYNGYDVIYAKGNLDAETNMYIGDEYFFEGTAASIWLHRNGEFIRFDELPNPEDYISKEDLRIIAQIHFDRVSILYASTYIAKGYYDRYN